MAPVTQTASPGWAVERRTGPRVGWGVPAMVTERWMGVPGGVEARSPPTMGQAKSRAQWLRASMSSRALSVGKVVGRAPVASAQAGVPAQAAISETERAMALRAMRSRGVSLVKWRDSMS